MTDIVPQKYSDAEEIVHAASHGLGALLSIAALFWMMRVSIDVADPWRVVASGVYGLSLIALFSASTIYHSLHTSVHTKLFKLLDHCAIYFLIAGSSTPFLLVAMQGDVRWWLFGAMWSLALAGVFAKVRLGHRHPKLSMAGYLLMGWLMVIVTPQLLDAIGTGGMIWLVAGGASYTIGAAFYMAKAMYLHHAVWHLFVLGGATCHFLAVLWYVLPVTAQA